MRSDILIAALGSLLATTVFADEKSYQDAAIAVIEISNASMTEERLTMLARTMHPELTPEEANAEAARTIKTLQSPEFRKKHAAIYMKHFTEPELIRLASLLNDPALKKFNEKRAIYTNEFMQLLRAAMDEDALSE